jgi:hypothetical protein
MACWLAQAVPPPMRFVSLGSRFRLRLPSHPASRRRSCPRLVVAVICSTGDSHPRAAAHAGRTRRSAAGARRSRASPSRSSSAVMRTRTSTGSWGRGGSSTPARRGCRTRAARARTGRAPAHRLRHRPRHCPTARGRQPGHRPVAHRSLPRLVFPSRSAGGSGGVVCPAAPVSQARAVARAPARAEAMSTPRRLGRRCSASPRSRLRPTRLQRVGDLLGLPDRSSRFSSALTASRSAASARSRSSRGQSASVTGLFLCLWHGLSPLEGRGIRPGPALEAPAVGAGPDPTPIAIGDQPGRQGGDGEQDVQHVVGRVHWD